jgi:hypothetical protein
MIIHQTQYFIPIRISLNDLWKRRYEVRNPKIRSTAKATRTFQ